MADWRPMFEFDPDQPGMLVHDRLSDHVFEWQPERHGRDWHQHGHHDWGNGLVERYGLLLDGWKRREAAK